ADPAWVLVMPPARPGGSTGLVTLYDLAFDAAVRAGWLPFPHRPGFTEHLAAIFARLCAAHWIDQGLTLLHGWQAAAAHLSATDLPRLRDPGPANAAFRRQL